MRFFNFLTNFQNLIFGMFFVLNSQCLPKSRSVDTALPLLFLLQSTTQTQNLGSGNPTCISLFKNSSSIYIATGYNVTTSECNSENLNTTKFFTDPALARAEYVSQIDATNAIYAGKSSCFSKSTDLLSEKSSTRTQNNTTSGFPFLANSGSGCIYLGASFNTSTSNSGSLFTNTIVYCRDASSLATIRDRFRTEYTSGPVFTDMKRSLDYYKGLAIASPALSSNPGWGLKNSAAQNMRLATLTELQMFRSASGKAILAFLNNSSSSCVQEILDANQSLKALYTASSVYGRSADKDAVTQAITASLICSYGPGAQENTNSGVCPSSSIYQSF